MSFQSSESQLKEALAALGELKALTEGLKAHAEAKTAADERLAKVESSVEDFKTLATTLGSKIESLAKMKVAVEKEDEVSEDKMDEEANELGGVNKTVISVKKKKTTKVAKDNMEDEDEELIDKKVEKKSTKKAADEVEKDEEGEEVVEKKAGYKAADEVEEGEDEAELVEDAKEDEAKAAIPPQFVKNMKKKKEEMEGEDEAEAAIPPQFLKNIKKKKDEAEAEEDAKAAEPMVSKEDETTDEDLTDEEKKKKAKYKKDTMAAEVVDKVDEKDAKDEEKAECGPKRRGAPAVKADDTQTPDATAQEVEVEVKAQEVTAPVAVATAKEVPAPKAEETAVMKAQSVAELEALKLEFAKQVAAREEALASVSKMKVEFESLMERIAQKEAAEKSAEEKVAKAVASMGVAALESNASADDDKPKSAQDLIKEYQALEQSDAKEARRFWLQHEDAIRSVAFGKVRKNA